MRQSNLFKLMKQIFTLLLFVCLCIVSPFARGQSTTLSGGGQAQGTSGTISYSIGQTVYQSFSDNNYTIVQGVQQPFEISVIASTEEAHAYNLELSVFPNPTVDVLKLSAEASHPSSLNYRLFNMEGRLLKQGSFTENTEMNLSQYPTGTYLLNISNSVKTIQTFKVIKN